MEKVEVTRLGGPLRREHWVFEVFEFPKVYLEYYAMETRKTPRHKWRASEAYTRLALDRHSGIPRMKEEPEVPEEVLRDALKEFASRFQFEVWRRR